MTLNVANQFVHSMFLEVLQPALIERMLLARTQLARTDPKVRCPGLQVPQQDWSRENRLAPKPGIFHRNVLVFNDLRCGGQEANYWVIESGKNGWEINQSIKMSQFPPQATARGGA